MSIVPSSFARECVSDGWNIGVQPHYMLAVARFRSHIVDDTDGDRIGPFRLTVSEWSANRTDPDADIDFLATDITSWRRQCAVFSLMSSRTQETFIAQKNKNPSVLDLYLAQWPSEQSPTLSASLQQALDDTADLLVTAISEVLDTTSSTDLTINDVKKPPANFPSAQLADINTAFLSKNQITMAGLILQKFADAGYGKVQQVAALANAFNESGLDPKAKSSGTEQSFGLFQINTAPHALGAGMDPTVLTDPEKNISIILNEVNRFPLFKTAGTTELAVKIFVFDVEKPADKPGQTAARIATAHKFLA